MAPASSSSVTTMKRRMSNLAAKVPNTMQVGHTQINPNSQWVNSRGAWVAHIIYIMFLKYIFGIIPWISTETSWTLTNWMYNISQYIMFHAMIGTPFEVDQGAYDGLTMWEQIDQGAQFTPTKKFLTVLPIFLFLLSTHYTHYDVFTFWINIAGLLVILIAKLPLMHRVRLFGINFVAGDGEEDDATSHNNGNH
ncbi:sphingolipid homeostasis protein orm1 [Tieghemiomyces parasiticus]|uniref:Sphingolipid homeostasis protein orm1 n=1 Tax=Tieghemiomyces parasiticus TaxID=78921 RepID=A0A9W8DPP8_9FUNG|nr:sphingolipid homeostasis protein orm1 [Tieghemiomyces parasiticus]